MKLPVRDLVEKYFAPGLPIPWSDVEDFLTQNLKNWIPDWEKKLGPFRAPKKKEFDLLLEIRNKIWFHAGLDDATTKEVEAEDREAETEHQGSRETPFAYCAVLYGHKLEYFMGAMVLGYSLLRGKYDAVLMVTKDVPEEYIDLLRLVYDSVVVVDYVTKVEYSPHGTDHPGVRVPAPLACPSPPTTPPPSHRIRELTTPFSKLAL